MTLRGRWLRIARTPQTPKPSSIDGFSLRTRLQSLGGSSNVGQLHPNELLAKKEEKIRRLRKEVEALRIVAALLEEDHSVGEPFMQVAMVNNSTDAEADCSQSRAR